MEELARCLAHVSVQLASVFCLIFSDRDKLRWVVWIIKRSLISIWWHETGKSFLESDGGIGAAVEACLGRAAPRTLYKLHRGVAQINLKFVEHLFRCSHNSTIFFSI